MTLRNIRIWIRYYYYKWMFQLGAWLKERACVKVGGTHDVVVDEHETRCVVCGKQFIRLGEPVE